jgi:hypothetical protein
MKPRKGLGLARDPYPEDIAGGGGSSAPAGGNWRHPQDPMDSEPGYGDGPGGYNVEDNDELDGITHEQLEVLNDPARIRDLEKQIEYIASSGQSDDFEGDVGPWQGTPIFTRLKSAWERGMKKRKQQSQGGGKY